MNNNLFGAKLNLISGNIVDIYIVVDINKQFKKLRSIST